MKVIAAGSKEGSRRKEPSNAGCAVRTASSCCSKNDLVVKAVNNAGTVTSWAQCSVLSDLATFWTNWCKNRVSSAVGTFTLMLKEAKNVSRNSRDTACEAAGSTGNSRIRRYRSSISNMAA